MHRLLIFTFISTFLILSTSLFSFEIWAADLPFLDSNFSCITDSIAEKYIQDFSIDLSSFGGKELCSSVVDSKKLFNDLQIIENGTFTSSGQNILIRGFVESSNYYPWLKNQTRGVQRGNDLPWATAYNSGGYFTMQDGWAKLSTLGRVGTFIHEARHTEGFYHIPCTHGPYAGTSLAGCDTNYSYGGSHAVEMEYYARVSVQGTNFHPVYKKMARLMAMARSNFVFNTIVMQPRESLLAVRQDGLKANLFDQGIWYSRELPEFAGKLKRTSFGAVIFNGFKAMAVELYKNSGFNNSVDDTYSYFKLIKEAQDIKDFEEFDSGVKRYVVHVTTDNKIRAFDFPKGQWGNPQQVPFAVAKLSSAIPNGEKAGLYVVGTDNQIFYYQPENQNLVSENKLWDPLNKDVIRFKNQNFILRTDGRIYSQSGEALKPWSETKDLFSGLVAVPMYNAFDVVKD